ncbi:MAG: hypothetical protein RL757_981 [Bacteroidota bacterium]|jgi:MtN3 and saliva related transmembrane protein
MDITTMLGNAAAFLTTISFLPQAVQTIRTKDTTGLSLPMYALFFAGVLFWVAYGFRIGSMSLMIGNSITVFLAGIILFYKIREILVK